MSPEKGGKGPYDQENPGDDQSSGDIFSQLNFPKEFTLTHLASEFNPTNDPEVAIVSVDLAREAMLCKIIAKKIAETARPLSVNLQDWEEASTLNWLLQRIILRCEILELEFEEVMNRAGLEVEWLLTFVKDLEEARIVIEETSSGDEL